MILKEFLSRLDGVEKYNGYYKAMCPVHNTKDSSMSVKQGEGGTILLHCHCGCETSDILDKMGLKMSDLFPDQRSAASAARDFKKIEKPKQPKPWTPRNDVVASYEYRDDGGHLLAVKDRFYKGDKKQQYWRYQDATGVWFYGNGGATIPLYKHECIGNPVYLVEGEKDVDTMLAGGLYAVTNPNGAGEWKDRYTEQLRGYDVCIIPDNDEPGRKHADTAANALHGVATSVKLLDLSELWEDIPEKGDVTDYVEWCRSIGRKDADIFKCLDTMRDTLPEFVLSEDSQREQKHLPLPSTVAEIDFNAVRRYRFIISTILPEGVTFLNAYAKTGKSRLILQMCLAVCWGVPFLGYATNKADVLYCALEDEMSDFAPRLELMLQGQPAPKGFYYYTKEAFDNKPSHLGKSGGLAQLISQAIEAHPGIALVCVDVFGGIRSEPDKRLDFTDHERKDLDELIKIAADYRIALVVAHHVGKSGEKSMAVGNDFMGSGAGSFTIPATVHSVWYMARDKEDEKRMLLAYRGRRIKSGNLAMRDEYPRFDLEGDWDAVTFADDPTVATIKFLVREFGQWRGTVKQLIEANQENENLPPIIKKPNKVTIEKFARQLQSIGIRYIQHPHGTASVEHEFIRANVKGNKFAQMPDYEGLEWEDIVKDEKTAG